jgi:Holliday junction resolvase
MFITLPLYKTLVNYRKRRGTEEERRILTLLRDRGFAVIRSPASGSKRKDPVPDIVAMKDGVILLIEVKSRRNGKQVYVKRDQAEGILEFAHRSGGELFLAVKRPRELRFLKFSELRRTDGGNFVATEDAIRAGLDLDALVRYVESKFSKPLDSFL